MSEFGQTKIGIVMTQNQPVFGTTRQETIRFVRALGYKIVDHHADIGIASLQNDFFFSESMTTCIDAGKDALPGCFFIT